MSLDEYIFGKLANFFDKRKKERIASDVRIVKLEGIRERLSIFARAVTGNPILIYPAKREGGYKNNSFFLPEFFSGFPDYESNLSFYIFRVLFLSIQKQLGLNWKDHEEHPLSDSRKQAELSAPQVLEKLFKEFPVTREMHDRLKSYFIGLANKSRKKKDQIDLSYLYGKWMYSVPGADEENQLKNFNDKAKKALNDEIETIKKAGAVEEVVSLEVDEKQQEDDVLNHYFEKIETAEEWEGGWKDFDGDDDLDEHEKALEELNMKYTVRVDDTTHSVYQADFMENTTVSESAVQESGNFYITYDEWDYKSRSYKPDFCRLYPKTIDKLDPGYYKKTLADNASTLMGLRKMLTNVNNKYQQRRRQSQGEDIDIDALTDLFVDVHTGHTPSENIYLSKRKKEKDLSILMLLDISLSTDGYAAGNRVIDVEKQVSILFGEILNEFYVDFSIDCFYSKTRNYATYVTLKGFDEKWEKAKLRVGAVQPEGYTRIGTALRHSGSLIERRPTRNKWIILISDGKPNDYDKYEGKYGINDVKQALRELNAQNINTYALAIEANARYYLPQMFGTNHYEILTTPVELLQSLVKLYDKIKYKS